jgi:hypothetical protein
MFIATTGKIKIDPAILKKEITVNNGISRIKNRPVIKIFVRTCGGIGNSHADAEVFTFVGWVNTPVGAEKQVESALVFIKFGGPKIAGTPGRCSISLVDPAFILPMLKVGGRIHLKTVFHTPGSNHIVSLIGGF